MRRLRVIPLLLLVAGLAGCGGSTGAVGGGGGDGASEAPASAVAFATLDTSFSSDQWDAVNGLLDKFPAKDRLLMQLRASFERDSKLSWEKDVKPALGDELDLVVLDLNGKTEVVGLTQPKDEGKFKALVKKADASSSDGMPTVLDTFDGWTLIADSQAKLDAFEQAASGDKLSDDAGFKAAMAKLPGDALAKVWVDTPQLLAQLRKMSPQLDSSPSTSKLLDGLREGAAVLVAHDDGVELTGRVARTGAAAATDYTAKLVDAVPSGALLYVSFRGSGATANMSSQLGPAAQALPQLVPLLGAIRQLTPLFANEGALYVLSGFPIPEVTLLTQPRSPARGKAAIARLFASLSPLLGGARIRSTSLSGVPAREVSLGQVSIYFGSVGKRVFLSTSRRVVSELGNGGQKLADDPTFKEARDAAGMPSATSGFVYLNLKDSIPLIESLVQLSGTELPADVDQNLRHLRTFLAFGSAKSDEARFTAFLEAK